MLSSSPLLSSPEAFQGLSGHLHKLSSPQQEGLTPSQDRQNFGVPTAGAQGAKSTRGRGDNWGLPGVGENVDPDVPQHCIPAVPSKWSADCRYPSPLKSRNSCSEMSPACNRGGCRTPAALPHSLVPGLDTGGGWAQAS